MKLGNKAPGFSLKDKDSKIHSLEDIKSDYTIIYFYPSDNTPGCTIEANAFNNNLNEFKKLNTTIIGISGGDEESKTKFCKNNNLKIILLSDTDFKVSSKYELYGEKSFMGKKYMGISRNTFILDQNKKIIKIYDKVKVLTHSNEVLEFIKSL
jgi:peroxiredoxin Q/BCP